MRFPIIVAWLTFVAGCAGPPQSDPAPVHEELAFDQLVLTGCHGGLARMEVPEQLLNAPVPRGWEGENGLPTTVTMWAFKCQHVSLGPFERGPIDLVVESHGKFTAPMNCRVGDYHYMNILTRIVWSDAEVAAAVEERLGVPTSVGAVTLAGVGEDALSTHEVTWDVDGQTSSFTVGRFENRYSDIDARWRYVWPIEDHLGFAEFHWIGTETWLEPTASYGSFSDPMLLGNAGLPVVTGVGSIEEEMAMSTGFRFYEGSQCEKELPPS